MKWQFLEGSGGGQVIKLLACWARGPGFDSWFEWFHHLNLRDWVYPASKSQYDWKIVKATTRLLTLPNNNSK